MARASTNKSHSARRGTSARNAGSQKESRQKAFEDYEDNDRFSSRRRSQDEYGEEDEGGRSVWQGRSYRDEGPLEDRSPEWGRGRLARDRDEEDFRRGRGQAYDDFGDQEGPARYRTGRSYQNDEYDRDYSDDQSQRRGRYAGRDEGDYRDYRDERDGRREMSNDMRSSRRGRSTYADEDFSRRSRSPYYRDDGR